MKKRDAEAGMTNAEFEAGARRNVFISFFRGFWLAFLLFAFCAGAQTNPVAPMPPPRSAETNPVAAMPQPPANALKPAVPMPEFGSNQVSMADANHTNAPAEIQTTDIHAESGKFNLRSNVFVYHGGVRVDDPRMKLTCDVLTAEAPRLAQGIFNRVTADKNVVIDFLDDKGQTNHAVADKAVYTYSVTNSATNAVVELTGNPVVSRPDGSTLKGDPIIWNRMDDTVYVKNEQTTIRQTGTNSPNLLEPMTSPGAKSPRKGAIGTNTQEKSASPGVAPQTGGSPSFLEMPKTATPK